MSELERAVETVVAECLCVREGEHVLVVCNRATAGLGECLCSAAGARGAEAMLLTMAERARDGEEPPGAVAAAMAASDVVLAPTVKSLSHTSARRLANEAGARIATFPGATEDMLARMMSADMAELRRRGAAVAEILTRGREARISCAHGSDLRLSLTGREGIADDGDLGAPGAFGNLPCGEGFVSPLHSEGEGRLFVDGTISGVGVPAAPAELLIEGGRLVGSPSPAGERLLELLRGAGEDGTHIAELGVGTNERAVLSGNVLEDEKILGTCHVAFGASAGIGGEVQVPVHLDCVITSPTLEIDGEPLVRDGELLV